MNDSTDLTKAFAAAAARLSQSQLVPASVSHPSYYYQQAGGYAATATPEAQATPAADAGQSAASTNSATAYPAAAGQYYNYPGYYGGQYSQAPGAYSYDPAQYAASYQYYGGYPQATGYPQAQQAAYGNGAAYYQGAAQPSAAVPTGTAASAQAAPWAVAASQPAGVAASASSAPWQQQQQQQTSTVQANSQASTTASTMRQGASKKPSQPTSIKPQVPVKPAYTSVLQPSVPSANVAAKQETKQTSGQQQSWPPDLNDFTVRAFKSCKTPEEQAIVSQKIRQMVLNAQQEGRLFVTDWKSMPLPSPRAIDKAVKVQTTSDDYRYGLTQSLLVDHFSVGIAKRVAVFWPFGGLGVLQHING